MTQQSIHRITRTILILLLASPVWLSAQVGKTLIVNNFISDPDALETHLVITDVDGVGPNVKVSIYNEDGRLIYERFETLHAFGKLNYNPADYLTQYQFGFNQNPKFRGTIRVTSDGGNIAGQYWQFYKKEGMGYMNTAVPAAEGQGYDKLVCQHFVSDKKIDAELVLANAMSTRPTTVMVKFYSDEGGITSSKKVVIQPNGIVRINPYKATHGLRMTGTAYVEVIGKGKITGEYWQASQSEKYQVALPLEGVTKIR